MSFFGWGILLLLTPTMIFGLSLVFQYLRFVKMRTDYTSSDFKSINTYFFMPYCKLPLDVEFFKKTMSENTSWVSTRLPVFDMNKYDFEGVHISNCRFSKKTILPKDTEFFQKIANKDLSDCVLPEGDYSIYNFEGVHLTRTVFTKNSVIPKKYNFFKKLYCGEFVTAVLPDSFYRDFHYYDLSNTTIYVKGKKNFTSTQMCLMSFRNNNFRLCFSGVFKNWSPLKNIRVKKSLK